MEALFWGSASADLKITLLLIVVSFFAALILYAAKRSMFFSLMILSLLANASFLLNVGSDMFDSYNIVWLLYFSVFIWPILNILLIVYYAKTSPKKR